MGYRRAGVGLRQLPFFAIPEPADGPLLSERAGQRMNFLIFQEFFYVFYREILFVAIVAALVAGLLLAVIGVIRAIDES
jgi:hypothetical protein